MYSFQCSSKSTSLEIFILILIATLFYEIQYVNSYEYCPPNYGSQKYCLLRTAYYPEYNWVYWSGFYCYYYTDVARFVQKYEPHIDQFVCNNKTFAVPTINIQGKPIFYNYTDPLSQKIISASFKTQSFFNLYLDCCNEAVDCCENYMDDNNTNILPSEDYCPAIWDAWSCFPRTKVNTTARIPCSKQAYQNPESVCTLESEKVCYYNTTIEQAEWNQDTNYGVCLISPVYTRRHQFHVIVLSVSTVLIFPAVVIFLAYAKFRKDKRIILHRNLLIIICIKNLLTILSKNLIIIDALKPTSQSNHVMEENGVACRVLAFFESAAKNGVYACMLVDGYYLHKLIVRTFADEPKTITLYSVAIVLSILPSVIWATVVSINEVGNCWSVDTSGYQWIVDGFRIGILAINTVLLMDIIRILILKMNKGRTSRQTKAAFRATLFLIPLFGLNFAVTAKKIVIDDTCTSEDIYNFITYTIEGVQGIMVALLFCYINSEVINEFRNTLRKLSIWLNQKYGISFLENKMDINRRATTATFVQSEL